MPFTILLSKLEPPKRRASYLPPLITLTLHSLFGNTTENNSSTFINFFKRFRFRSSQRSIQYLHFPFCLTFARFHAGINPKLSCLIFIFFNSPTSANCRPKVSTLKENHDPVIKRTNRIHFSEETCEHRRA